MEIVARDHYRKFWRFLLENVHTMAAFGDHRVEFDLPGRRVLRTKGEEPQVIATIRDGFKGSDLKEFRGTVESEDFVVTTQWRHWLSTNMDFEILLKKSGATASNMVMRYDTFNTFRVSGILELRYVQEQPHLGQERRVEGTCAEEHQDLAEIIASMLLHYHHSDRSPAGGD